MKRNFIAKSSLVVLSLLLTAAGAYAQSAIKATIPFAFKVGTAQVPAGTYLMQRDSVTNFVAIRNLKTQAVVFAMSTAQGPSSETGKAIFHLVGRQYLLTDVCGTAGSSRWVFTAPKRHREVETATATQPSNAEQTVEIALK